MQTAATKCVKLIIIGLGNRGQNYIRYARENPNQCKIIAVAEPRGTHPCLII